MIPSPHQEQRVKKSPHVRRTTWRVAIAAAAAASLLLSACGSDDSGDSGSSGSSSDLSGTPVKFGAITVTTGPAGSSVDTAPATLKAWAEYTNANGGIDGHPVEIVTVDAPDPSTSVAAAKKLVQQDRVSAIIAMNGLGVTYAEYTNAQNIPVISGNLDNGGEKFNNWFYPGTNYSDTSKGYPLVAQANDKSKLAVQYCAEYPQCQTLVGNLEKLAAPYDIKVVTSSSVSATAPNYTAACLAAKDAGADTIIPAAVASVQIRVIQDCNAQGYSPLALTGNSNFNNSWLKAGDAVNNTVALSQVFPWILDETPGQKAFHEALDKYAPEVKDNPSYGIATAQSWTIAETLKKAVINGGGDEISSESITNGLFQFKDETLDGLVAPFSFVKADNSTAGPTTCFSLMAIKNGEWTAPQGMDPLCLK
jgi:branched-chain amino acid transport system substrate-binding protein